MIAYRMTDYVREYRFAAENVGTHAGVRARLKAEELKDWRFDFAFPLMRFAIEVEGVTSWGKNKDGSMRLGRHQTGKGMEEDLIKYDSAMRLGWDVYRCSGAMVKSGRAIQTIKLLYDIKRGL